MKNFKKHLSILLCAVLIFATASVFVRNNKAAAAAPKAKNVIFLITDGTNIEALTLSRWYNGGSLNLDEIACGAIKTYWSSGPITDSAPGGTAYSTGHKTDDKYIATLGSKEGKLPVATVLEAAKLSGKSTGVVATSEIMHATPADFTAHETSRSDYNDLMKQQIYNGMDVVLGGGDVFFGPDSKNNNRNETTDLRQTITGLGYKYITTKTEMNSIKGGKVWGMFAQKDMQYDIDRSANAPEEPTLAEMTQKAIDILSQDKDGFFLAVEGSKVDWAAHANDAVGVVSDVVAFDNAVKVALDFAKKDNNTVVVVVSDHGTGGLSIGGSSTNSNYSGVTFEESVYRIRNAKATPGKFMELITDADDAAIKAKLAEYYGITSISDDELNAIKKDIEYKKTKGTWPSTFALYNTINNWVKIGWTTGGHVGGDVLLFNYAPGNIEKLHGVVENIYVGNYMARVIGLDLSAVTKQLFEPIAEEVSEIGGSVSIDLTDSNDPIAKITKGSAVFELPVNTNLVKYNGTVLKSKLDGVTVWTGKAAEDINKIYVSANLSDIINAALKSGGKN